MTSEHLLDAMGLLDDDLIQEAEAYTAPKRRRNYGNWAAWAASFAVVLVLGYGLAHFGAGSGGGAANAGGDNQTAASAPSGEAVNGGTGSADSSVAGGCDLPAAQEPMDPASEGTEGCLAVVIGDVVYWNTGKVVSLFPDGEDVRYDISWYDEETGKASSDPELCYWMLEDGSVAIPWDFQQQGWMVFAPDPLPES